MLLVIAADEAWARTWQELAAEAGLAVVQESTVPRAIDTDAVCGAVVVLANEAAIRTIEVLKRRGIHNLAAAARTGTHRIGARIGYAGAREFFLLPEDAKAAKQWLMQAAERWHQQGAAEQLAKFQRARFDFSELIGTSPNLKAALDTAARVIPHDAVTVLITGETGTGKELIARAIHFNGPRATKPFVTVNCAALPPTLLESELFGYERGAFTGAVSSKSGLFEVAQGGTILLDEIGDLPMDLQLKLLRVLEERRIRRLGSVSEQPIDVRLITATHADLEQAVRERRFRQDLFYRIQVVPLHLPPLRERGDDVLLLTNRFLDEMSEAFGMMRPVLSDAVRDAIQSYSWPGNVRELRNAIERGLVMGQGELRAADVFASAAAALPVSIPFPAAMGDIEQAAARAMVRRFGGNKKAAAAALRISRSRLYRLLGLEAGADHDA